ncbi:MAG: HlyD family type I secretion periplasmic adaptor subunit [Oscillatoriophycideae cyanobacterium NC_groundwater_1537_Pr4_S-0.65um_50_18]|nr:HlyD family type I secretion periplasmic adaptor subunit [Oscillatoriophycideae cyanobacterium NC_groundwater_1537_Pr4_S-0.65um_50_18]
MMKAPPKSVQRRQTKIQFANAQDYLNYELGNAQRRLPPLYIRLLGFTVCAIVGSTIAWATFSKVDEVATAPAEVIPSTRIQPVKALSGGLLRDIQVKEGDRVKQGTPLVQLDPTLTDAEYQSAQQLYQKMQDNLARMQAELSGKAGTNTLDQFQDQLLVSRLKESQAAINQQQGAIKAAQAELTRLQATLRFASTKERSLSMLAVEGAIPRLDYLDTQSQVASLQAEMSAKEQELYQAQQEMEQLQSGRKNEILTQINQLTQEKISLEGQLKQAKEQRDRETIKAPVNGTIYNVKVVESGATIQGGEELLSIVPDGAELVLEAKVLNRDIAFVKTGMRVKIKLETLPYQEFGMIEGTVLEVSPNAVNEPELGLVYPIRVQLKQHMAKVRGQEVALTPGMTATAEIVTRQKTVMSFLLDPITASWDRAFSVR